MNADWIKDSPSLQSLDDATKASLREMAIRKAIPHGAVLFRPGDQCAQFPLVVKGSIRVHRVTESGREIVLYRVSADETCILTTASLLAAEAYAAEGVAETDVVAYVLGAERFNALMASSASFRALVFDGYSKRLAMLMARIEEILCTRVNVRLAERLLALKDDANHVTITHQSLAADLGTAREVIGRELKTFERSGWVRLSRGAIEVTNSTALDALIGAARD
jgi:CRP/FNR family transcriptional regulator